MRVRLVIASGRGNLLRLWGIEIEIRAPWKGCHCGLGLTSIDRFLQNTVLIFCLCFDRDIAGAQRRAPYREARPQAPIRSKHGQKIGTVFCRKQSIEVKPTVSRTRGTVVVPGEDKHEAQTQRSQGGVGDRPCGSAP